jgi:hypothetical protein
MAHFEGLESSNCPSEFLRRTLQGLDGEEVNMLATVQSSAVMGIDAYIVQVEIDIADGLPAFNTVGLPDSAVK